MTTVPSGRTHGAARTSRPVVAPESDEGDAWCLEEGEPIPGGGATVLSKLGGGHHYEAYLVWHEHLRTTAVAKLVRPGRVGDPATLSGLRSESVALASLNHPVVLRGYGAELEGPSPHLILEHLEGPRLSSLVRRYGALGAEQLAPLAIQLSAAAHYMHAEGWVHLDIKPANVIMGAPPRLIDLSIARRIEDASRIRSPIGTDPYMAPEQILPVDLGPVGAPADVFNLGVTLYRAATGRRPFPKGRPDAETPQLRWPQLDVAAEPLDGELPSDVADAIGSSLARDPRDRPNPAEIGEAFERLLASLPRPRLGRLKPRWG